MGEDKVAAGLLVLTGMAPLTVKPTVQTARVQRHHQHAFAQTSRTAEPRCSTDHSRAAAQLLHTCNNTSTYRVDQKE